MNEDTTTTNTADVETATPVAVEETTPAVDDSNIRTVRPGLFVQISTSIKGNVTYQRVDVVTGEKLPDGSEKSEWNTKKLVEDPVELERATKIRGQARNLIERLCTKTTIGLWCSPDQRNALNAARDAAEAMVAEFNRTAKNTKLWISCIPTKMEADDTRALRDITREISRLVQQMDAGVKEFDAEKIREAADEARRLSSMLTDDKKAKVNAAVEQARKAARTIVKRIDKDGEDKATVLLDIQRGQIESARIAFIDMEETLAAEVMPVVNAQRFADLDLDTSAESPAQERKAPERKLDLAGDSELQMVAAPSVNVPAMEV